MTDQLRRSYQRWLRAYPADYRRTHGLEMLTTLLDAAGTGRSRPTLGEVADLVLGGLRYRFAVPAGLLGRFVAVTVALLFGLLVSGTTAWLTWQATDAPPSIADSTAIARLATDQPASETLVDPGDPVVLDPLGMRTWPVDEGYAGPAPAPAVVHLAQPTGSTDVTAVLARAQGRLADAGWRTGRPVFGENYGVAWAVHGERVVRLEARLGSGQPGAGGSWRTDDPVTLWVSVHSTASPWVTVLSGLGLVAGMVFGWLATAWALRRSLRYGATGQAVMLLLMIPTLFVGLLGVLLPAVITGVAIGLRDGWSPQDSLLGVIVLRNGWPFAIPVILGVATLAALAAQAPRRRIADIRAAMPE